MYLVYIIKSDNRSYIGMTNDFFKRWKQHNKIIKELFKVLCSQYSFLSKYLQNHSNNIKILSFI